MTRTEIVDSHCHVSEKWYEPVETLIDEMERNGVDRAVLIQMNSENDNEYLLSCAERFPDMFRVVVGVEPLEEGRTKSVLRRAQRRGAAGVRISVRPTPSSPLHLEAWEAAAELGLPVSAFGTIDGFTSEWFNNLLQRLPDLRVVLEHFGAAGGDLATVTEAPRSFRLSSYDHVFIKATGLGEYARRRLPVPKAGDIFMDPIPDHLRRAIDLFGPERVMWGSDFPPVCQREGYGNSLRLPHRSIADLGTQTQSLVFGGTASSFFWDSSI